MKASRIVLCLILAALGTSSADALTARVRGTVKDPQGKPIEKVKITIELVGEITQSYTAHTNAKGEYMHIGVNPGKYKLTPSKEGYRPVQYSFIELQLAYGEKPTIADFVMEKVGQEQAVQPAAQEESAQIKEAKAGISLMNEGKVDEAIVAFERALAADPKMASVHYNLGLALERKEQPDKALAHFQEAVSIRPEFGEAYLAIGDLHMAAKKYEAASEAYIKATEHLPESYPAFYNLGVSYSNAGKYTEAEAAYRRACEISPNEPIAHYQLGMSLLGQSKNAEARVEFQKYLDLNPNAADKQEVLDLIQTLQ